MKKIAHYERVFTAAALASLGLSIGSAYAESSSASPNPVTLEEALASPELAVEGRFAETDFSDDPTLEELQDELESAAEAEAKDEDESEDIRIRNYNPATSAGKVIIKVHKSRSAAKLEYLEVFLQKSADPADLEPLTLFDDNTKNTALVSTAGTYGSITYVTPTGVFSIDRMEPMHYSRKYNNAPMPWSIFFTGGVAIHGATPNEFKYLGRVASHGCVRLHPVNAKLLYAAIKRIGKGAIIHVLNN